MYLFELFSDGGSFNNGYKNPDLPQFASCGITVCLNKTKIFQKSVPLGDATISYAELYGAVLVIQTLVKKIEERKIENYEIHLYSDSQYVVNSINGWIYGWIKKGWKSNSGDVQYKELWERLLDYKNKYNVKFHHIKGHLPKAKFEKLTESEQFYHIMNDNCDRLAVEEVSKFKTDNGFK